MKAYVLPGDADVVLVDDNPTERHLAHACYEEAALPNPWRAFGSGPAFLEYLEDVAAGVAPRPGLVLVDINMPILDGFTVVKRVRGDARFADMGLLIFTNSDDPADERRAREAGATALIRKPDAMEDYIALFRSLAGLDGAP